MNLSSLASSRAALLAGGAAILAALSAPAHALVLASGPIEITSESFNLSGTGGIPLGDGFAVVDSDIVLRESDTQTSTIEITVSYDELAVIGPRPDSFVITTDFSTTLFPVFELSPSDPATSYGGTLGSPVIVDTATPWSASSNDTVAIDLSALDPTKSILDLFLEGFDFSTLPFTVTNNSSSSTPSTLSIKKEFDQSVGGDPLIDDFIVVEVTGLSLGGIDLGELLNLDLLNPDLAFLASIPQVEVQGLVDDLNADPPFGPFLLTVSTAAVTEPAPLGLLAAGGLVALAVRRRAGR